MKAVNAAIVSGRLDASIPWIKREAVKAMSREYATTKGAQDSIAFSLRGFYDKEGISLNPAAVKAVQEAFSQNMFPEMRARWDKYPDNRSHFFFRGCFRCHGSNLATSTGQKISADCNLCHEIVAQGPVTAQSAASRDSMATASHVFRHPIDIEGGERAMRCFECHIGDGSIYLPAWADSTHAARLPR